jgi:membrane associated rhomboid family serine protease
MTYEGIKNGRYYTILTSALNHNGILHLGLNMLGLWSFGQLNIILFGPTTFTCLLVGSILAGGLAQYCWWQEKKDFYAAAVGISGGIFGLVAAQTFIMPRDTIILGFIPMPYWAGLSISVAISIAGLQGQWGHNIGHAGHLGGMAFGALFWLLVLRRRSPGAWMLR